MRTIRKVLHTPGLLLKKDNSLYKIDFKASNIISISLQPMILPPWVDPGSVSRCPRPTLLNFLCVNPRQGARPAGKFNHIGTTGSSLTAPPPPPLNQKKRSALPTIGRLVRQILGGTELSPTACSLEIWESESRCLYEDCMVGIEALPIHTFLRLSYCSGKIWLSVVMQNENTICKCIKYQMANLQVQNILQKPVVLHCYSGLFR